MIGADAVNPGVNLSRVDVEAGVEFGARLSDPFGFPGEATLPLGLGF
jgi:hypothetical protein